MTDPRNRCPTSCCSGWTPSGAPRTTSPSARSTCRTTRCCASRCAPEHIKPRLLGHWGTSPGLNLVYAHLNRLIRRARRSTCIYLAGPGHGGPALVANVYLEGTLLRDLSRRSRATRPGMRRLFRQFSTPGGIPSHVSVADAGLDPRGRRARLRARARVRRGVRQPRSARRRAWSATARPRPAPLEGSWKGDQLPQPGARRRRAADPAPQRLQDRRPDGARPRERRRRSRALLERPRLRRCTSSTGDDPPAVHRAVRARRSTACLDASARSRTTRARGGVRGAARVAGDRAAHAEGLDRARRSSTACRSRAPSARTRCRSPTCATNPEHLRDARGVDAQLPPRGALRRRRAARRPSSRRSPRAASARMGANPHANGGRLLAPLDLPDFARLRASTSPSPATVRHESTRAARRAAARRLSCATPTRRTSACSARTRPTRTGSARCSRSRTAASSSAAIDDRRSRRRPTGG